MDQALYDHIRDMQAAANFRTIAGNGISRVVDSPYLKDPIGSAFERIGRFADPVVEVARLGTHRVHFTIWGIDAAADTLDDIDLIKTWTRDGAIAIRHMAGGRC